MYLVYLFKEKETEKIIYVGSSARPAERMKEHLQVLNGKKESNMKIYDYMRMNNLQLYKDVEIIWVDSAENKEEMHELEEKYYYKYVDTIKNDRPAELLNGEFNPKRRKVRCINDGKEFNTITECADFYNLKRTTISGFINGHKKTLKNTELRFEYVNKNV